MKTDRCSNNQCSAGDRCPICDSKFVPMPNMVCDECEPGICDVCGNGTHMIYKILDKRTRTTHRLAVKSMGAGATSGHCKSCREYKTLGSEEECLQCKVQKLNFRPLRVCYNCLHYAEDSKDEWIGDDKDMCGSCGSYKYLNAERVCESCYNKTRKKHKCVDCQSEFLITVPGQILCADCMPICVGCKEPFVAKNRADNFCKSCLSNIKDGICVECLRPTEYLDITGRCIRCENEPKGRAWCKSCNTSEVAVYGMICDNCANSTKACPDCGINDIRTTDYICRNCYDKREIENSA